MRRHGSGPTNRRRDVIKPEVKKLLDHLTQILHPWRQVEITDLYQKTLNFQPVARLPLVLNYPIPEDFEFPPYPHSEIFDDPEKMLYNELVSAFGASIACRDLIDDDLPYTIRANFGTGIIASMFGARIEQLGENPPWVRPLETLNDFKAAIDRDPLDFHRGWCPRVVQRYQFYHQVLADYPELAQQIQIVLPDLQGPLDTVEMLRGSDLYEDFYTDPDLIDRALSVAAQAQVGFAKYLAPYLTDGPVGFSHQHGLMIKGNILIRTDAAIMISPQMYRRQVAPHDEYVLRALAGGGLHSCGRIEHNIPEMFDLPSIRCFDFGDPLMNDMDAIYSLAQQKKIPLIGVTVSQEELISGRVRERFPTGACLVHEAGSLEQAKNIMQKYRKAVSE